MVCLSWYYIDKNTVLTAAHCLYDTYNNVWYKFAYIYPARNGEDNYPYGWVYSTNFYVNSSWINAEPADASSVYYKDVQNDWGIINLNSNHYYHLNFSTTAAVGDGDYAAGYPADKGTYYLYRSLGKITSISGGAIVHSSYVTGGMSGGPIYYTKNGVLGAISINSTHNWGLYINSTKKSTIQSVADNNGV